MSEEEFIILVYYLVDEMHQKIICATKLRKRGPAPSLTDNEVLTMLVVGEYLGFGSDKKI